MSLKCKACNTSVYPNDAQISLDGTVYHKPCAKCADCKCQISLSNFTKSGDTLLCKTHYFKRFHEEGSYLGGDKYSRASSQEIGGKKATEPVNASGSSAATAVVNDEESKPVSTTSLKSRFEKPVTNASSSEPAKTTKKLPSFGSAASKCAVCTKSIYPNDSQIALDGDKYHKECAKCEDCKCTITLANFTKSGTTLLCKTHYFTRFSVSGSYLGGEKFEKKADRDGVRGPSPSASLFNDCEPTETTTSATTNPATEEQPPTPPDTTHDVEPPVAPAESEDVTPDAAPVVEAEESDAPAVAAEEAHVVAKELSADAVTMDYAVSGEEKTEESV